MIAATALLLLFIGIHDAWDSVMYIAIEAYTKAWTANLKVHLLPDTELLEMICENERDSGRLVGK